MTDNDFYKLDKSIAEGHAVEDLKHRSVYNHGSNGSLPLFYRFIVLDAIFDPSIIDSNKVAYYQHALQVSNMHYAAVLPRNTIIAQRVIDATSGGGVASQPPMFLFPFFPSSLSLPCKPGEHVWVMFEDPTGTKNDMGYWMCKIVEPGFVEDVNHTHAPRANDPSFIPGIKDVFDGSAAPIYEFRNGRADTQVDGTRYTIAESATIAGSEDIYESLMTTPDAARLMTYEAVPRFRKRPADTALEGSNNTLIVLGRDRTGAVATYTLDSNSTQVPDGIPIVDDQNPGAGVIDIVAGRGQTPFTLGTEVQSQAIIGGPMGFAEIGKGATDTTPQEGDPDLLNDRSRIYVAQRTLTDENFGIDLFNEEMGAGTAQGTSIRNDPDDNLLIDGSGTGAIVIKSDKVRLIARSDIEILVVGVDSLDSNGNLVAGTNPDGYAAIVIKANGDIIFRPSAAGYIKLGDDSADRALLCSDVPAIVANGIVTGPPLITTMGGQVCGAVATAVPGTNATALQVGQGSFASKILVK